MLVKLIVGNTVVEQEVVAADHLQDNKYNEAYLADGYSLTDFVSRSREDAKDEAKRLRKDEGQVAVYTTLKNGWFGVFAKDAPESDKPERAAKVEKPVVEMTFEWNGMTLSGTTKGIRKLAVALMEAAKNAEFEADLIAALASKADDQS